MKAVGGASAIAALAELAVKVSVAAWRVGRSFVNAPKEITNFSSKCGRLRALVEQIHRMSQEMSATDDAVGNLLLLPGEHEMLFFGLEQSLAALQEIAGLYYHQNDRGSGGGSKFPANKYAASSLKPRLNWALLGKKKAASILQNARMVEEEVGSFVTIFTL